MVTGWTMAKTTTVGRDLLIDGGAVLAGMGLLVRFVPEVLKLYVKVIGAKNLVQAEERVQGVGVAAGVDQVAHLAVTAGSEADESLGVGA
jgi:hypothetical protein